MVKSRETKEEPLEKQLWESAEKLRKNINAAEYKHVVLGLVFLKYISDAFEEQLKEETELNQRILENLAKVKLPDDSLKVDNYE